MRVEFGYNEIKKWAELYYKRLNGLVNPNVPSHKIAFADERLVWFDDDDREDILMNPGHSNIASIYIDPNALMMVQSKIYTKYEYSKIVTQDIMKQYVFAAVLHELSHLVQYFDFYKYGRDLEYCAKIEAANDYNCRRVISDMEKFIKPLVGAKFYEHLKEYYAKTTQYMEEYPKGKLEDYDPIDSDDLFIDKMIRMISPIIGIQLSDKFYKWLLKNDIEGISFSVSLNKRQYACSVEGLLEHDFREYYLLAKWIDEYVFDRGVVWGIKVRYNPVRKYMAILFKNIKLDKDPTGMECRILEIDPELYPYVYNYK